MLEVLEEYLDDCLFDEVDGYSASAGTEGDQIKLGIRRTEYYWNRKIVAGSTPTIKDFSRIERLYNQTNQMRYYIPCPECGHMQYLKWSNMKWRDNDPDTVAYGCESCGCLIPHSKKRWMVEEENGELQHQAIQTRWIPYMGCLFLFSKCDLV